MDKTKKVMATGLIKKLFQADISILAALILLCIMFGIASPYFFTVTNIMSIGTYASIIGTMAAGLTVAMLLGGMDVSQYALAAFCGMVLGYLYEKGVNSFLIILIVLASGIICGLLNAFVITKMKISPIIATMGTQFVFRGFSYLITNGAYIRLKDPVFSYIGSGKLFGFFPFCLVIMILTYLTIWYMLKYTRFGRHVYAVGGNIKAASLAGIDTDSVRFKAYMIAAVTAAIGGIITASQSAAAMCNAGEGNDMDGIAAVILGGLGLAGGKGKVTGTLIGVLIICVLLNGMTLLNVQAYWQKVIKGLVLIFAVFIDSLRNGLLKKA